MWELENKEGRVAKNWCLWNVELEKTLESPLDSKEINQSVLKEINSECSLKGLILKLKLQYFGHLMWTADSLEKTPMLGKIEGRRWRGKQRMRWLASITNSMNMNLGKLQDMFRDKEDLHAADHGIMQSQTQLGNWTTINMVISFWVYFFYYFINRLPCSSLSPGAYSNSCHVHWVGDAIQPSHFLLSPSPPAFNVYQHQGLFKCIIDFSRGSVDFSNCGTWAQ